MHFRNGFHIQSLIARWQDFPVSPQLFVPGRVFNSISFRLSGTVSISDKNQTYMVTPQNLLYLPKGYDYSTTVLEPGSIFVIHFWAEGDLPTDPFVFSPEDPVACERLFSQIVKRSAMGHPQDLTAMSLFYQLLALIQQQSQATGSIIPSRMLEAKKYIHRHFHEEDLSVAKLALDAQISQTYFRREFHNYFGRSPREYIRNVRIEHAKSLLEAGDLCISEVALQSGYANVSYFSSDFRNTTGQSPSAYRANAALYPKTEP